MNTQPNSKIIGAFVVGFALVAGAYVVTNFGKSNSTYVAPTAATQQAAPIRSAIAVTDEDGNGIEDWRDEFVTTEPIIITDQDANEPYTPPDTLTGQVSINLMEDFILSQGYGPFADSEEQIIANTIQTLERETGHSIYDVPDILIKQNWQEADIREYANSMALAIMINGETDFENELFILNDILNRQDTGRIIELQLIAKTYADTRDAMLLIPVPEVMVKEHLDLINTFHAVYNDIIGMTQAYVDPAYSLLRIKRYQDDTLGKELALANLYSSLEPYASLFSTEDPAVLFTRFRIDNTIRI